MRASYKWNIWGIGTADSAVLAEKVVALKETDISRCPTRAQLRFKRTRAQLKTAGSHGQDQLEVWLVL